MLGSVGIGSTELPKIALLHGFTQTSSSWAGITSQLANGFYCLAVDAPDHGSSSQTNTNLWQSADQIVATCGRGVYCGYSMGARMALHCALAHPNYVGGLILVSGTPGIGDEAERLERRFADDQMAQHIRAVGTDKFIDEWLARPMFAALPFDERDIANRKTNSADGLATSLELCGVGTQDDLWPRLSDLRMPVLIIAGALDTKFAGIATRMHERIADSELKIVADSGHTVHLEQPHEFHAILRDWLTSR